MQNILFSKKDMESCVKEFRIKKEQFEKKKVDEKPSYRFRIYKKVNEPFSKIR